MVIGLHYDKQLLYEYNMVLKYGFSNQNFAWFQCKWLNISAFVATVFDKSDENSHLIRFNLINTSTSVQ